MNIARKYRCPACKEEKGVNIQYGLPSSEMMEAEQRGEIALGGCCIEENSPERKCLNCGHEWRIKRQKRSNLAISKWLADWQRQSKVEDAAEERKRLLARLTIERVPSFGDEIETIELVQLGNVFMLEVSEAKYSITRKSNLPSREVKERLSLLAESVLPAFPISELVCDGAYIEISIFGICAEFTYGWWTVAPKGARALEAFVEWLISKSKNVSSESSVIQTIDAP